MIGAAIRGTLNTALTGMNAGFASGLIFGWYILKMNCNCDVFIRPTLKNVIIYFVYSDSFFCYVFIFFFA